HELPMEPLDAAQCVRSGIALASGEARRVALALDGEVRLGITVHGTGDEHGVVDAELRERKPVEFAVPPPGFGYEILLPCRAEPPGALHLLDAAGIDPAVLEASRQPPELAPPFAVVMQVADDARPPALEGIAGIRVQADRAKPVACLGINQRAQAFQQEHQ